MPNYNANGWNIDDPVDMYNNITDSSYDSNGYDRFGYNSNGYDVNGYNSSGYNSSGYSSGGYDINGLDISGNYVTPDPPTNVTATITNDTQILVEWTASATGGNGLAYRIYDQDDGILHNGTFSTNVIITRYIPNVNTYKFRIDTVITSAYASSFSDWSNEVTFPNVMMPVDLSYSFSNNNISLVWYTPVDSSITDYIIEEVSGALSVPMPSEPPIGWTRPNYTVSTGGLTHYAFSDLVAATYKFHVYAVNANGERSTPAISDDIDLTPPDAPTNLSYTLGSASITLNWEAPEGANPRNSQVSDYRITYHTGDEAFMLITWSSNSEVSKTIPELYNDTTYFFRIASQYNYSEGRGSLFSELVRFDAITVPNTPWKPQAPTMSVNGYGTFYIEWPPNLFETYVLTEYFVTVFHHVDMGNGLGMQFTDDVIHTNEGLTLNITTSTFAPGTTYYCNVTAVNEYGSSSPSSFSDPLMAATVPSAPSNVSSILRVNSLEITWDPSTDNGYSDIITYNIYDQNGNLFNNGWSPGSTYSATNYFKGELFLTSIYITAQNAAGESAPSDSYYINGSLQPDPPTNVIAVAKNGAALISWTAPTTVVEKGVTEYIVTSNPDGYSFSCEVSQESLLFTGLTNGTPYTFTVIARNSGASSVESDPSNPVTPFPEPPSAPINILVSPRSASAVVAWEPSTYDGGSEITGYRIVSVPDNKIQTVGPDITSVTMTGLKNGTSYTFRVFGVNAIGFSGQSNSITPYPLPGNPKIGVPVIGNTIVTLSWTAVPGAVASPITAYKLTRSDDETFLLTIGGGNSGTCEITEGLTIGTPVTFYVRSVSAIGQSALATPITVTPLGLPGAPGSFTATPIMTGPVANQGKFATLAWTAPDSNGGTPITGYIITYNSFTSPLIGASVRTFLATGLTNGAEVTFNIIAKNKIGNSGSVSATINPSNGGNNAQATQA